MLITEFFFRPLNEDDNWHGSQNDWHGKDQHWSDNVGQWNSGQDPDSWHTQGVAEDLAVQNMVTTESHWDHVVAAKEHFLNTLDDPKTHKHQCYEFLKELTEQYGKDYCDHVCDSAKKLAKGKDND